MERGFRPVTPGRALVPSPRGNRCVASSPGDPGGRAWPRPSQRSPGSQDTLCCPSPLLRSPSPESRPGLGTRGLTPACPVLPPPASPPQGRPRALCPRRPGGPGAHQALSTASGGVSALGVWATTAAHTCAGCVLGRTGPPGTRPVGAWNLTGKKGGL